MTTRKTDADRRSFLKASAAIGGIAVAGNYAVGAHTAANEVIKVGLIGCGGRGKAAVKDILRAEEIINGKSPKVEIVAVGDAFMGQAEGAVRTFKSTNPKSEYLPFTAQIKVTPETTFDGVDAYKKVIGAGVDLVILATPPGFRPVHLEAAINAGKHIFCEKPVCVDATGARKCYSLVNTLKEKNLALVAGTQRRHQEGYLATVKKIKDGAIGDVVAARCAWNGQGIWFNARRPGESDAAYHMRNWYHFLWVCGDHIVEQHVHNLDVINWIVGDHPVRATGMGGRAGGPSRPAGEPAEVGQIWDHFAVEYEYKNGLRMYSFCRHIPGDNDVSETVFGSKGMSRVSSYQINREEVYGKDKVDPYVQEHVDLLNSIRAGKPLNELQGVTDSTFTAVLGRNSAYACKALKWDDALASAENYMPANLTMDTKIPVTPAPTPGAWKLPPKA